MVRVVLSPCQLLLNPCTRLGCNFSVVCCPHCGPLKRKFFRSASRMKLRWINKGGMFQSFLIDIANVRSALFCLDFFHKHPPFSMLLPHPGPLPTCYRERLPPTNPPKPHTRTTPFDFVFLPQTNILLSHIFHPHLKHISPCCQQRLSTTNSSQISHPQHSFSFWLSSTNFALSHVLISHILLSHILPSPHHVILARS